MQTVLVIGSGGREYELARQMSLSAAVGGVIVAPGNAGTALLSKTVNAPIGPIEIEAQIALVYLS